MKTREENKLIAEFMGGVFMTEAQPIPYWENIEGTGKTYPSTNDLNYHTSWDQLMPVVRKLVEMSINEDGWELFESEYYDSLLETVPVAVIEDVFKVVVEFIEWIKENE